MNSYRKKSVVVQAEQFEPTRKPWPEGVEQFENKTLDEVGHVMEVRYFWRISTLKGLMVVCPGDWIITGVGDERYPVRPSIFDATYERVEDSDA